VREAIHLQVFLEQGKVGARYGYCQQSPTGEQLTKQEAAKRREEMTRGDMQQLPAQEQTTSLTLTLLMWRIWRAPTNNSKWRMGFNLVFKGLILCSTNAAYPMARISATKTVWVATIKNPPHVRVWGLQESKGTFIYIFTLY
jgi:Predicted integral membrane protein